MKCGLYPCEGCPNRGGPIVGSRGNPLSPLLIIGESPGKHEMQDRDKRPFVGPSGKVIDFALRKLGFEAYFINAMMCNPGTREDKDEALMQAATANCRHHVLSEIALAPRKVILVLGAPALWSITNDYSLKITQHRGMLYPSEFASVGIVPSVHPAFLMAGGGGVSAQQFFRDVDYAIELVHGKPPKKPPNVEFTVLETYHELRSLARLLRYATYVAADIETSDLQPQKGRVLCIGIAIHPNHVYVIPEHLCRYADMLFHNDARFIWHNGQFDVKWLHQHNCPSARIDEDTILLSYALDEIGRIHSLDVVARDWLNSPNWEEEIRKYLPKKDSSFELVPRPLLHKYMAYDVGNMFAIFHKLRPRVAADKHSEKLYTRTLIPATRMLAKVEMRGIYIDQERNRENHRAYKARIDNHRLKLFEYAKPFPESGYTDKLANSHVQLKRLIYEDLRMPKYKGKISTDRKVLEHLPDHPFLRALSESRKDSKEYGTYVKSLASFEGNEYVCRQIMPNGRVHSSIALFKTRTGRLASNDPNIQNIPRSPQIRGQYVAAPGRRLVEVDLNQAELRVLATLSRDPELCRIYLTKGMSLHDEVRATIWGYPDKYTPQELALQLRKFRLTPETRYDEKGKDLLVAEQKMRAKNVNFGTVYGITSAGLAEQCDCTVPEAQQMLDAWFAKFPGCAKFIEQCKNAPFEGKTLITAFGRKKRPGVVSQELAVGISNEFANFPEQSTASDITVQAAIELSEQLTVLYDSHICNLIHDAILVDCPDDDSICQAVARITIDTMQRVPKDWGFNVVPFIAEAKQGMRWGSLEEMHI